MSQSMVSLINKFRGCLTGGLIGDCMVAPFEGDCAISRSVLYKFIAKYLDESNKTFQMMSYTDDTAMTKSVSESLIELKAFDAKDMAKKFTNEYIRQPKRGYGNNVIDVFAALKFNNFEHPYEPSRRQFNGSGSYGNGGAMRTSPIALFGLNLSDNDLIELAVNCAQITHSNRNGYNGAVLQCLAIRDALRTNTSNDHSFDVNQYLNGLIEKMLKIETNSETESNNFETNKVIKTPFVDKLNKIKEMFENESKVSQLSAESVADILGNDVSALKSVPSAIYSVLRAQKPIVDFESNNPFVRTLCFAISLGGDTDTIACMACSIAGALYGSDLIPKNLQKHCEDIDLIVKYSEQLYDLISNNKM